MIMPQVMQTWHTKQERKQNMVDNSRISHTYFIVLTVSFFFTCRYMAIAATPIYGSVGRKKKNGNNGAWHREKKKRKKWVKNANCAKKRRRQNSKKRKNRNKTVQWNITAYTHAHSAQCVQHSILVLYYDYVVSQLFHSFSFRLVLCGLLLS